MDIKKTFIKVFNSKTSIFGRTDAVNSKKALGGLANNNKNFLDLISLANKELGLLNTSGTVDTKEKIEIPNTAFTSIANPTIEEVRVWADANLTPVQKINSELFMIEQLSDWNGTTFTTLGSTAEQPDYVWDITEDSITELHRRTNNGDIWYVSTEVSPTYLAQKGNPNRPFSSIADLLAYSNLVDGDTVHFYSGEYTILSPFIKGNVTYHFENVTIVGDAGNSRTFNITDESLDITGNLICNNPKGLFAVSKLDGISFPELHARIEVAEVNYTESAAFVVFMDNVINVDVNIKCKTFTSTTTTGFNTFFRFNNSTGNLNIEFDNVFTATGGLIHHTNSATVVQNMNYNLKCKNVYRTGANAIYALVDTNSDFLDSNLNVEIDNFFVDNGWDRNLIYGHDGVNLSSIVRSNISIRVHNALINGSPYEAAGQNISTTEGVLFGTNEIASATESVFDFHIDNLQMNTNCKVLGLASASMTNCEILLTVDNCRSVSTFPIAITDVTDGNTDSQVTIKGTYYLPNSTLLTSANLSDRFTLNADIYLKDTLGTLRGDMIIMNSKLISKTSTGELLIAPIGATVRTFGSASNNLNIAGVGSNVVVEGTIYTNPSLT